MWWKIDFIEFYSFCDMARNGTASLKQLQSTQNSIHFTLLGGNGPVRKGDDQCLSFFPPLALPLIPALLFSLQQEGSDYLLLQPPAVWDSDPTRATPLHEYRIAAPWQDKLGRKWKTPPSVFAINIMLWLKIHLSAPTPQLPPKLLTILIMAVHLVY